MRGTMIYLPGRIRLASKTALKWHKKQMLSLIWLHTSTIVCCTSFYNHKLCVAQQFTYPVEFDQSNLTGLKNSFKMARKTNVEPNMATY